jgi:hypothetical protein
LDSPGLSERSAYAASSASVADLPTRPIAEPQRPSYESAFAPATPPAVYRPEPAAVVAAPVVPPAPVAPVAPPQVVAAAVAAPPMPVAPPAPPPVAVAAPVAPPAPPPVAVQAPAPARVPLPPPVYKTAAVAAPAPSPVPVAAAPVPVAVAAAAASPVAAAPRTSPAYNSELTVEDCYCSVCRRGGRHRTYPYPGIRTGGRPLPGKLTPATCKPLVPRFYSSCKRCKP